MVPSTSAHLHRVAILALGVTAIGTKSTVTVQSVDELNGAVVNSSVDRIFIEAGTFDLTNELHINRSLTIAAVKHGIVSLIANFDANLLS